MAAEIDGEAVAMDIKNDAYFGMNAVASSAWQALENPVTAQFVIDHVRQQFDAAPKDDVESDVLGFLTTLLDKNLIRKVD